MTTSFFKSPQLSIFLKFALIGIILLLLMIPNAMIRGLITERSSFEHQTRMEVSQTWGSEQVMVGPVLSIPYTTEEEYISEGKKKVTIKDHLYHITPETLKIDGNMVTTSLQKSIYTIWLYTNDFELDGHFSLENIPEEIYTTADWSKATITLGISDSKGIEGNINAQINNTPIQFNPGSLQRAIIPRGVSADCPIEKVEDLSFHIDLTLRGSGGLHIVPISNSTTVTLNSDWHSPGFVGMLSPSYREVSNDGFQVIWDAGKFAKNNPDQWSDTAFAFTPSMQESFGVELIEPVNHYQKNTRSAKYAFLILSLTFLIFFFFELINSVKVHAIQYILVGLSLTVFYLLLLSFTEHVGFDFAYCIAALATLASILMYTYPVFKNKRKSMLLGLILVGLYLYIFVLLQLEAYALLVGSVGVFIILSSIMYMTRNINYYRKSNED